MSSNEERLHVQGREQESYARQSKETMLPLGLKKAQIIIMALTQIVALFFFSFCTDFQHWSKENDIETNPVARYYPIFQDINVMIFVGFGFLMTYLKRHSWTAVCFNFLMGAWSIQIAILFNGLWGAIWSQEFVKIKLDVVSLIQGDFAAAAVLISFGAVLGKVNAAQLMVMSTLEVCFYALNSNLGTITFGAVDMGGSCFIHAFGALFGLAVSYIITPPTVDNHSKNAATNTTFTFAMIGTVFLWMFWPSFNGALAVDFEQTRVIVTTVLSLTASCISAFIISTWCNDGKLAMTDIVNASLAGGVIIGTYSNLEGTQILSILIGLVGGVISTLGFEFIQQPLWEKWGIHDTCGVAQLHFLPGFFGTCVGIVAAAFAGNEAYGQDISVMYPARANGGRTAGEQSLAQFIGLAITLGIALVSGLITGKIIKPLYQTTKTHELYEDEIYWVGVDEDKED